jgi:hypothetical protein
VATAPPASRSVARAGALLTSARWTALVLHARCGIDFVALASIGFTGAMT